MSSPSSSSSSSSSSHSRHGLHPGQVLMVILSKEFRGKLLKPNVGMDRSWYLHVHLISPYCMDHSHKNWILYIYIYYIFKDWQHRNMWHIASWTWGTQLFLFLHLQFLKMPWTYQRLSSRSQLSPSTQVTGTEDNIQTYSSYYDPCFLKLASKRLKMWSFSIFGGKCIAKQKILCSWNI